jgi:hypothetical protein
VHFDEMNIQDQQRLTWPAAFPVVRAYLDQLQRSGGLATTRLAAVRQSLVAAEQVTGAARREALSELATSLDGDVSSSSDAAKVRLLASAVRDLGNASR